MDKAVKIRILSLPVVGRCILLLLRTRIAFGRTVKPVLRSLSWLYKSKELTNLTYDLSELNKEYLISLVSHVTQRPRGEIARYVDELETDEALKRQIRMKTLESPLSFVADAEARYGRRVGWYAFARALKPRVIVETGVDKGLGACVLTSALLRNSEEGFGGYYYGTDNDPNAGYLLSSCQRKVGVILRGDSIESILNLDKTIDLFVNDSDHSADYEAREYQVVSTKLAAGAVILGDNAHVTSELLEFSLAMGRSFLFFREEPAEHWYPGAGIGISFTVPL